MSWLEKKIFIAAVNGEGKKSPGEGRWNKLNVEDSPSTMTFKFDFPKLHNIDQLMNCNIVNKASSVACIWAVYYKADIGCERGNFEVFGITKLVQSIEVDLYRNVCLTFSRSGYVPDRGCDNGLNLEFKQ